MKLGVFKERRLPQSWNGDAGAGLSADMRDHGGRMGRPGCGLVAKIERDAIGVPSNSFAQTISLARRSGAWLSGAWLPRGQGRGRGLRRVGEGRLNETVR